LDTRRREDREDPEIASIKRTLKWGAVIFVLIFGLATLFMGIFTVGQYERDIITRYGAFFRIAGPGLNYKLPWVDGAVTFDLRERKIKLDNIEAYTADTQFSKIDYQAIIGITYDNAKLEEIYQRYGSIDSAIDTIIPQAIFKEMKNVVGKYTSTKAIQDRAKLNQDVMEKIDENISASGFFDLKASSITDVEFAESYTRSIEDRMKEEVLVQKKRQEWEKEKYQADIVRTQADAYAYQIEAKGKAEALAIDLVNQALAKSPKYIEKITAEKWDGKLPQTMLPGTTVPFISVK